MIQNDKEWLYDFALEHSDINLEHVAGYEDVKEATRKVLKQ